MPNVGTTVTVVEVLPKMQGGVWSEGSAGEPNDETVGSPDASRSAR